MDSGEFLIAAPTASILWPILAHMGLVIVLYFVLGNARAKVVKRGETTLSDFVLTRNEPQSSAVVAKNLTNQFELPVLFHVLCILLITLHALTIYDVIFAWIFVLSRIVHSIVAIRSENVLLRMRAFLIGAFMVIALFVHMVLVALNG